MKVALRDLILIPPRNVDSDTPVNGIFVLPVNEWALLYYASRQLYPLRIY